MARPTSASGVPSVMPKPLSSCGRGHGSDCPPASHNWTPTKMAKEESPARLGTQDAAKPQEQREERLAVAGAGKAHSQARGASDACMGGLAGPDQGSICSLEAVVIYAVLLRERDYAGRGGRDHRRA